MAVKFKLDPNPTFKAKVSIPVPGSRPADVEFEFRHFTRDDYAAIFSGDSTPTDKELILKIVKGWELEDEFNADNLDRLLQNYQGAASAIVGKFANELIPARLGN